MGKPDPKIAKLEQAVAKLEARVDALVAALKGQVSLKYEEPEE